MGQNQFTESLVEVMLSWMRWLTGWFWSILNSEGTDGGFLLWFLEHWVSLAAFLIVVGVIVDWLVWMIRWRPYWLWLRKRQIIYEEVPVHKKTKRKTGKKPVSESEESADEFDDPFADPYAPVQAAAPADDLSEWDSTDDPYARPSGGTTKKVRLRGRDPV